MAESASRTDSSRGEFETKHVRRRIDETKTAIKIERCTVEFRFKSLREYNLENVARADEFLRSFDCGFEIFTPEIAAGGLRCGLCNPNKRKINGFLQPPQDRIYGPSSARINLFDRAFVKERV